jgi:hypothetical protein
MEMNVTKWFTPQEIINNLEKFGEILEKNNVNPTKDLSVFLKAFVEIYNSLIQGEEEEDENLKGFALAIQDDLDEKGESTFYFSVRGGEKIVMVAEKAEFKLGVWSGEYKEDKKEQSLFVEFNAKAAKELLLGNTDLEIMVQEGDINLGGTATLLELLELWFDDFFGLLEGGAPAEDEEAIDDDEDIDNL